MRAYAAITARRASGSASRSSIASVISAARSKGPLSPAQRASMASVRAAMVARQRAIIGAGGIVVEGRDIGTTVAPDADVKVFLTADERVRAERRGAEVSGGTVDDDVLAATSAALRRRDAADAGRVASPLSQAPDATVIDATAISADAVIARVVELAEAVRARGQAS